LKQIDLNNWNRKLLFEHFKNFADPYFSVIVPFDVSNAYENAKSGNYSFFARYLHDCMKSINEVDNLKYRMVNHQVVEYDEIHASPTLMRPDRTFGFSFIKFDEDLNVFINNINKEQDRINKSTELYPPEEYRLDCIHCSAMPWINFTGHKEPVSGQKDSVPKFAFSKAVEIDNKLMMNVAINVNHALVDGYHVSLFSEKFQEYLNHKQ
jgi:chloramphenicol O-acetyltransferase type A